MYKTIIINKTHHSKESYNKNLDLIEINNYKEKTIRIDKETYENYLSLKEELLNHNININIDDAYRSFANQQEIINEYSEDKDYLNKYVAKVGESEHHTGLAIDLYLEDESKFEEVHKYLSKHGFILRYPKDKENITGYNYEPWHIRYVGVDIANEIMTKNITLEEYLGIYTLE